MGLPVVDVAVSTHTGNTTTPQRYRFNNDRSAIRNHHSIDQVVRCLYGYSFNLTDHDCEIDLQVQGIEMVPEGTSIVLSFWQWQLRTQQLTDLNDRNSFMTMKDLQNIKVAHNISSYQKDSNNIKSVDIWAK